MQHKFIGREKERAILDKALHSDEPEMVAVIGRRRVGKTFLVKQCYGERIDFEITGIQNAGAKEQLQHFTFRLRAVFPLSVKPKWKARNWLEAFVKLTECLDKKGKADKMVVFFDELPWFDSHKSGFLRALGFFWNSWAVNKQVVVVICGSAASWMIQKVVYDKGGLHNRITQRIDLQAFNLYETEKFIQSRHVNLDRYQILLIYMAMGGIPHYLKEIEPGYGAAEIIEKACFLPGGILTDEFLKLYPALFENAENHLAIIRAIAQKWKGLSRKEILSISSLSDGGTFSGTIEELVHSGFVTAYNPFGKQKKECLYRLTDGYSLFYLHFIENRIKAGEGTWKSLSQSQVFRSWSGYAFESICIKHLPQIKKALGISGVYTEASSFFSKGNENEGGIQIDLVLDRNDRIINLFEMKFYASAWVLDKIEASELRERVAAFKRFSKTNKQVFLTVVTTFGIKHNANSLGLIDRTLDMDVLFEP